MTHDYHQYFIKDGCHVGDYEGMYQNCSDPWQIESLGLRLDMKAALLLLEGRESLVQEVLDIGSGLGFFAKQFSEKILTVNPAARFTLTDISPTAVAHLTERFSDPNFTFQTFDLRGEPVWPAGKFDLLIMSQVLWGLLEDLPAALAHLAFLSRSQGFLLISQHFPGSKQQGYGAEIVAAPEELAEKLQIAGFNLLQSLETNRQTNHHWAALWQRR